MPRLAPVMKYTTVDEGTDDDMAPDQTNDEGEEREATNDRDCEISDEAETSEQ